jgi:hypothetical protein
VPQAHGTSWVMGLAALLAGTATLCARRVFASRH